MLDRHCRLDLGVPPKTKVQAIWSLALCRSAGCASSDRSLYRVNIVVKHADEHSTMPLLLRGFCVRQRAFISKRRPSPIDHPKELVVNVRYLMRKSFAQHPYGPVYSYERGCDDPNHPHRHRWDSPIGFNGHPAHPPHQGQCPVSRSGGMRVFWQNRFREIPPGGPAERRWPGFGH